MEVIVYAVYLIGLLAAFSALVVSAFAHLPADMLVRGARAGRFADLGALKSSSPGTKTGRRWAPFTGLGAHAT